MMKLKREDPKLLFFIDNFVKALWIVDFWLEHSDTGMLSTTGDTSVEVWISTCCILRNNFRLDNSWTIPAFLPWYKANVAPSTPIFLTFIKCELNLPCTITRNAISTAITYWQEMVKDWDKLTFEKSHIPHSQHAQPSVAFSTKSASGTLSATFNRAHIY